MSGSAPGTRAQGPGVAQRMSVSLDCTQSTHSAPSCGQHWLDTEGKAEGAEEGVPETHRRVRDSADPPQYPGT